MEPSLERRTHPLFFAALLGALTTTACSNAGSGGDRPAQPEAPGGKFDGAFVQDYEYIADLGDLDECNGRFCVTPEFPDGTYAYFMTKAWPVVPRAFRGTSVQLKEMGPPGGGPGGPRPGGPGGPGGPRPGGPGGPPPGGPPPRR